MKTIIMAAALALTVSAAFAKAPGGPGIKGGGFYRPRTTIVVGGGFYSPFYAPFGYYGYPYYPYATVAQRPTKLDMEINDIKNDYADKIASVRLDRTLTGKQRREQIREFRRERDNAVLEARRNYYKQ